MTSADTIRPWLSRDERKLELYRDDPYFWEGIAVFEAACGGRPASEVLRRITFLLVKPEAIVGRRIARILGFLSARGYRITGTWPVRLGRQEVRALWRYQINAAPLALIRTVEMIAAADEMFLLGLYLEEAVTSVTAAELLSASKGSSSAAPDPHGDEPLRDQLGQPALMVNFIHAPDEPADMLREIAVLCDARQQEEVLATLVAADEWPTDRFAAAASHAHAAMTSRYWQSAAHDLDAPAAMARLRMFLRAGSGPTISRVARAAIESGHTAPEHALDVVRYLERAVEIPKWDRIMTAVGLVDGMRTGRVPLIGAPPRSAVDWRQDIG